MAGCARVVELFISTPRRTRIRLKDASIHDPRSSAAPHPGVVAVRSRRPSSSSAGTPLLSAAPWRRPCSGWRTGSATPHQRRGVLLPLLASPRTQKREKRGMHGAIQESRSPGVEESGPRQYLRSSHPDIIDQLTRCRCVSGRTLICQRQRECIHLSAVEQR